MTKLSSLIASYMNADDMKKRLTNDGADPIGSSPEEFARLIKAEYERWGRVVKLSGAKID